MNTPQKNEALKNRKVFTDEKRYFNVPSKIFVGFIGLGFAMFFISKILSIFFTAVTLTTLYIIHKDDPDAFTFAIASLFRPLFYAVGNPQAIAVKIVVEEHDETLTFVNNLSPN